MGSCSTTASRTSSNCPTSVSPASGSKYWLCSSSQHTSLSNLSVSWTQSNASICAQSPSISPPWQPCKQPCSSKLRYVSSSELAKSQQLQSRLHKQLDKFL